MARILDQVIGHDIQVNRLIAAAKNNRLGSTLLFVGPPGIGKKQVARGLAQALVCEKSREGCGDCGACLRIEKGESESFCLVEPTEIQIKIEQVRVLKDFTKLRLLSRARVAIVDEAHMMTPQSANSLLKILEEPPPDTYFILITGQESGLLATLRSRCHATRFSPLTLEQLKKITSGPEWILASAQGRIDRVEELKQDSELRQLAIQGFQILMQGSRFVAMGFYQSQVKEKERALKFCQWWQQLVRDSLAVELGQNELLNPDLKTHLQEWNQNNKHRLSQMSLSILQLERDIMANVDRTLLFENFWKTFAQKTAVSHV